ncbi:cytochrome P450 monooxygenase, partial [Phellopilus nigrolimitatus]
MALIVVLDVAAVCATVYTLKKLVSKRPPLPPGPRGLPLVGNILDLPDPDGKPWLHWQKHKALYGPISSVTVLGQTMVIINDYTIAVDLFEKKSAIYSDRPTLTFGGEMVGWDTSVPLSRYGERFRKYRRNFHEYLGTRTAVASFTPIEEVETRRFLLRTMRDPSSLHDQIRRTAGAIILRLSHGYTIEPEGPDKLIDLADDVMTEFMLSLTPGLWMVDVAPFMRYLPDWFPGTAFKRIAAKWRSHVHQFVEQPFAFVKAQIDEGTAQPSFVSTLLQRAESKYDEFCIKWCAAAVYGGGADTTVSALYTFYLAMTLHPEAQRKAQEEIDSVVGGERLPGFEDRAQMPYIEAVLKETMRWNLVAPLGLPHSSTEDSMYDGYFIPKGSILMANSWFGFSPEIGHNPDSYNDPMAFRPERFLGKMPEMNPHNYAFGFGRRICPGSDLADASMWLSIAMALAVFDIKKARDAAGHEITPNAEFHNGAICHPKDFKCAITPRSERAAALVRSVEDEHPYEKSDAKMLASVQ